MGKGIVRYMDSNTYINNTPVGYKLLRGRFGMDNLRSAPDVTCNPKITPFNLKPLEDMEEYTIGLKALHLAVLRVDEQEKKTRRVGITNMLKDRDWPEVDEQRIRQLKSYCWGGCY